MNDLWVPVVVGILLIGGLGLLLSWIRARSGRDGSELSDYERIEVLMSPAERSLFGVLKTVAGDELEIFAKVRMADVLAPSRQLDPSRRRSALNRTISKHFDYVVCMADDLRVLCAVELDDRSHRRRDRRERDDFVSSTCAAVGLPLVRVKAAPQYSAASLGEQIRLAVRGESS